MSSSLDAHARKDLLTSLLHLHQTKYLRRFHYSIAMGKENKIPIFQRKESLLITYCCTVFKKTREKLRVKRRKQAKPFSQRRPLRKGLYSSFFEIHESLLMQLSCTIKLLFVNYLSRKSVSVYGVLGTEIIPHAKM